MVTIDNNNKLVIITDLQSDQYASLLDATVNVLKSSVTNEHRDIYWTNSHMVFLDFLSALLPTEFQCKVMLQSTAKIPTS